MKIQAYLEILPKLEEEFNVVGKVFDSWYVNSKTLLEDTVGDLRPTRVLSRVADTCLLASSPKGNT